MTVFIKLVIFSIFRIFQPDVVSLASTCEKEKRKRELKHTHRKIRDDGHNEKAHVNYIAFNFHQIS